MNWSKHFDDASFSLHFNQLLFMLMCDPAFLSEIGQHPNRHLNETASYTAIIALWGK
jgi:hypothetical protein